jgi:hypothetical protein
MPAVYARFTQPGITREMVKIWIVAAPLICWVPDGFSRLGFRIARAAKTQLVVRDDEVKETTNDGTCDVPDQVQHHVGKSQSE